MQHTNKNPVLPVLALLSSAILWGLIWYPYRLLNDAGVNGLMASFITYGLALLLGLPFYFRHLGSVRGAMGLWLAIVLTSGWTNVAYVLAVIDGEIMRVMLLFYLAPLWTVLFARLILGERLGRPGYAIMLLSLAGALVMLWQPDGRLPLPASVAEWMGLSAGMSFALTNVLSRRAAHIRIEAKSIGVWLGATLIALPMLLLQPGAFDVLPGLAPMVWLALIVVALAMLAVTLSIQYGLMHVQANRAIVILLFELVVAAISAYFLAGELLHGKEWLGAVMIIFASLFSGNMEHKE
jgi:drug/metabolite transporter (DMT)-like permease